LDYVKPAQDNMKIAFVGKGGSGKSSVSWLIAKQAAVEGMQVLAIDADYNMDLAYSLGWSEDKPVRFFNHAEPDLLPLLGLGDDEPWNAMLARNHRPDFRVSPADVFTARYSQAIDQNLNLLIWGPPHENLMYGTHCSHAYIAPIKFYLPFLKTSENDLVVIDSVAGTDMVSYGLYLGADAIVCVVEGTRQSIGVYRGIKRIAEEFEIPLFVVFNKSNKNELHEFLKNEIEDERLGELGIDPGFISLKYEDLTQGTKDEAAGIIQRLRQRHFDSESAIMRMKRWKDRLDSAT
jgi:CO dehydrogenase maturation factor